MNNLQMSSQLYNAIKPILDTETSSVSSMRLFVTFWIENKPESVGLTITDRIRGLTIDQSFVSNYTDTVSLALDLFADEQRFLWTNYQNLMCEIIGERLVSHEILNMPKVNTKPIFIYRGRAVFCDKKNLAHLYNLKDIMPTTSADEHASIVEAQIGNTYLTTFQIIPDLIYEIRHKRLNFILRDADISTCIKFIGKQLEIPEVKLTPPDNTTKYTNLIFPLQFDIANMFSYLQQSPGLGVYNNGLSTYITNGTLFVYPYLEINKTLDETLPLINFYYTGAGKLAYDAGTTILSDDGNLHAVIDSKLSSNDTADAIIENKGNGLLLHKTANIIDMPTTLASVNDKYTPVVPSMTTLCIGLSTQGAIDKVNNIPYLEDNGNPYALRSELRIGRDIVFSFRWMDAIPFSITPISRIRVHMDDDMQYRVRSGLPIGITYHIVKAGRDAEEQLYATCADIQILAQNIL